MDLEALKQKLAKLSPEQRQQVLAQYRGQEQGGQAQQEQTSPLQKRDMQRAELSFAQQRLWLMEQIEGAHYKYNMVSAYTLTGPVNVAALEQAFATVVDRHTTLQSRFEAEGENVWQVIDADYQFALLQVDLSDRSGEAQQTALRDALLGEACFVMKLAEDKLFRVTLYRLSDNEHILQLNVHHAIFDGFSKGILFKEVGVVYRNLCVNPECSTDENAMTDGLKPMPLQFSDYAHWQRNHNEAKAEKELEYWRETLADAEPMLDFPTDRVRATEASSDGGIVKVHVPAELTSRLRELSRQQGVTLFMTMLAAFKALMHRYTGQQDILIGTPVDNRDDPRLHQLIGYFLNTVVLRTDVKAEQNFSELVGQVRDVTLKAFQHQDVPFEQVIDVVKPQRSQSVSLLFQVMFVFQHASTGAIELHDLNTEKLAVGNLTTKYDMYITFLENEDHLSGWLTYRKDLYTEASMQALLERFYFLLDQVTQSAQQPLHQIALIPEQTQSALLEQSFAKTTQGGASTQQLLEALCQQIAQTPEAIALIHDDEQLTYQQLAKRIAHMAVGLRQAFSDCPEGETPLVAYCEPRSINSISLLVASVFAGVSVLAIEPSWPEQRIQGILSQVKPQLMIGISDQNQTEVTQQFDDIDSWLAEQDVAVSGVAGLRELITENADIERHILLFTSGSTGLPKGVKVAPEQIFNRIKFHQRIVEQGEDDVMAQRTSLGFIDAQVEVWGALLGGMRLVILSNEVVKDPFELVDVLAEFEVSHLVAVPSLLNSMVNAYPDLASECPKLRHLICSGEALTSSVVTPVFEALPNAVLWNMYGSTEVGDVSFCRLTAEDFSENTADAESKISLGAPLDNCQVLIVDAHGNVCPDGMVGYIYVRSPGMMDRYIGQDESSLITVAGQQWFNMNDRGRRRLTGEIDYLGRADGLIKIRGFRVDPSEIERALLTQNDVVEAACVKAKHPSGHDVLIAYVVADEDSFGVDSHKVKQDLRRTLPDYMIPTLIIVETELPYTYNGKIDRRALIAQSDNLEFSQSCVPPSTDTEKQIHAVWLEVLQLDSISIEDNFFDLGGQSLLAVRVCDHLREKEIANLGVQDIFELLTIKAIAAHVDVLQNLTQSEEHIDDEDYEEISF